MKLELIQTNTELFSAEFSVQRKGETLGTFKLSGMLGSREGVWSGALMNEHYSMERISKVNDKKAYRPYELSLESSSTGVVYQTEYNGGFFNKFSFNKLRLFGREYEEFSVSMGKEGKKSPVYFGNHQIALIEKDSVIYNELNHYHIFAIDEESAKIAVIFALYNYTLGPYNSGEKAVQSVRKTTVITTNKTLKAKYNPNFKSFIEE